MQNFRMPAAQIIAVALVLLLAFGGRATAVINAYLNIIPLPMMPQGPVEEEEERHGKAAAKSAATDRRHRERVPTPGQGMLSAKETGHGVRAGQTIRSNRVLPEHEVDYRNGIGAPLRC